MGRTRTDVPAWCAFLTVGQLLEQNRKVTLTHVDKATLKIYDIGRGYEHKVLSALRWLDLIDDKGDVTDKLKGLRVVGDEFQLRLQKVATEAYADLVSMTPPDSSTKEQLINYFINKHQYPHGRAVIATNFLINLWKFAGLALSADLTKSSEKTMSETEPKTQSMARSSRRYAPRAVKSQVGSSTPDLQRQDNTVIMLVEGRRHDFNLQSSIDKVIFEALSRELLKSWGKQATQSTDDTEEDNLKDDKA